MEFFQDRNCSSSLESLRGLPVLLPAVSYGSLGQLSVDLILNSFSFQRVGYFESPFLIRLAGNDAYHGEYGVVHTAMELYVLEKKGVKQCLCVQIRSPFPPKWVRLFVDKMVFWFKTNVEPRYFVCLSGLNGTWRTDSQLDGSQFRYLSSRDSMECAARVKENGVEMLENDDRLSSFMESSLFTYELMKDVFCPFEVEKEHESHEEYDEFGVGPIKLRLRKDVEDDVISGTEKLKINGIPITTLYRFCGEGLNVEESKELATLAIRVLGIPMDDPLMWKAPLRKTMQVGDWMIPPSWDLD